MQVAVARQILFIFAILLASQAKAVEFKMALSSDSRGSLKLANRIFDIETNSSTSNEGGVGDETEQYFNMAPPLKLGISHNLWSKNDIRLEANATIHHVSGSAHYPNGAKLSFANASIFFDEPISISISSWDIAIGPSVSWSFSTNYTIGGGVAFSYQKLWANTVFGDWHFRDKISQNLWSGDLWIKRKFFQFNEGKSLSARLKLDNRDQKPRLNAMLSYEF